MANANIPFGLRPVSTVSGAPYTAVGREYVIDSGDSTAVFIGDPVKITGGSTFLNGQTYSNVIQAATGDVITGVVVGVCSDTRDSLIYRAASTTRRVLVCDDPNVLFEIQQGTGGTPLTANDIGLNANFAVGSGSTATGLSGVTLNNVGEATTNTLDLKIVGMVNRADNDPGSAVGTGADASRFLVRINRHRFVDQLAGV